MKRRDFLTAAAATFAALPLRGLHAAGASAPELRAIPATARLLPDDYPETGIWGYDGGTPGPVLRAAQGDTLRRRLVNGLDQPTAVHWHGIRIDNAMDGVPGLTQEAVASGDSFDYAFTVPDAGTYWYHSHNRSMEQVARGLYGMLIVDEATPPDVDVDLPMAIDDWHIDPDSGQITDDFDNLHDMAHAGRIGNLVTVNSAFETRHEVAPNQRLRLRLLNAANARIFSLGLSGLEGWIVALDGMPLEAPEKVGDSLVLASGQRADLLVDVTAEAGSEAHLVGFERDGGFALATFAVSGTAVTRRPAPDALPANPVADLGDIAGAPVHDLRMEGGAMGGLRGAMMGGQQRSMQELMAAGQVWALNGVAGRPDDPLFATDRGKAQRIRMVNDTAFAHAMHLHGHHFREIRDGSLGPWRDTLLVDRGETREIALPADNPGKWLLHCHMLGHQTAGMTTWFDVS